METNVAQSRFWNAAGNENSRMWKELDVAAESGVWVFKIRGMEKYICLLWKWWNKVLEAQPNLVQIEGWNKNKSTSTKLGILLSLSLQG